MKFNKLIATVTATAVVTTSLLNVPTVPVAAESDTVATVGASEGNAWMANFQLLTSRNQLTWDEFDPHDTNATSYNVYADNKFIGIGNGDPANGISPQINLPIHLANYNIQNNDSLTGDLAITVETSDKFAISSDSYVYSYDGCDLDSTIEAPSNVAVNATGDAITWSIEDFGIIAGYVSYWDVNGVLNYDYSTYECSSTKFFESIKDCPNGDYTFNVCSINLNGDRSEYSTYVYTKTDAPALEMYTYTYQKQPQSITLETSNWGISSSTNTNITFDGFVPQKTTFGELKAKYSGVKVDGLVVEDCDYDLTEEDFDLELFIMYGPSWTWQQTATPEMNFSDINANDTDVVQAIGYIFNIKSEVVTRKGLEVGDVVTFNNKWATTPTTTTTATTTAPITVAPETSSTTTYYRPSYTGPFVTAAPATTTTTASETTTKPADEATEPQIKGEEGKTGWEAIEDTLADTEDGEKVVVKMNGATEVPKEIFKQIKGKDIALVIELDNGFVWTINGEDVTKPITIDLGIGDEKSIPAEVINNVTGEHEYMTFALNHDGDFGFKTTLTVDVGEENEGYYANLYWYTNGGLEFICADKINSKGMAELTFTHASEYIIVIDETNHGKKSEVDSTVENDTDDEESKTENDVENNVFDDEVEEDSNPLTGVAISFTGVIISAAAVLLTKRRKNK